MFSVVFCVANRSVFFVQNALLHMDDFEDDEFEPINVERSLQRFKYFFGLFCILLSVSKFFVQNSR